MFVSPAWKVSYNGSEWFLPDNAALPFAPEWELYPDGSIIHSSRDEIVELWDSEKNPFEEQRTDHPAFLHPIYVLSEHEPLPEDRMLWMMPHRHPKGEYLSIEEWKTIWMHPDGHTDCDRHRPLFQAVERLVNGPVPVLVKAVRVLLNRGANPHIKSSDGKFLADALYDGECNEWKITRYTLDRNSSGDCSEGRAMIDEVLAMLDRATMQWHPRRHITYPRRFRSQVFALLLCNTRLRRTQRTFLSRDMLQLVIQALAKEYEASRIQSHVRKRKKQALQNLCWQLLVVLAHDHDIPYLGKKKDALIRAIAKSEKVDINDIDGCRKGHPFYGGSTRELLREYRSSLLKRKRRRR